MKPQCEDAQLVVIRPLPVSGHLPRLRQKFRGQRIRHQAEKRRPRRSSSQSGAAAGSEGHRSDA